MVDLSNVDGFDWDENNRDKNWISHKVSAAECEETFFNVPLVLADDVSYSKDEDRYYLLGQTDAGRRLFIAFTVRNKKIRVVSARDMSRKERQTYEETTT